MQKVYEEKDGELVPFEHITTSSTGRVFIGHIYKHINAWGDSMRAQEYYDYIPVQQKDGTIEMVPPRSKLKNGYKPVKVTLDKTGNQLTSHERSDEDIIRAYYGEDIIEARIPETKKVVKVKKDAILKKANFVEFTNHSGGAKGADTQWDIIGREYGMVNNKHYYVIGNKTTYGNTPISKSVAKQADVRLKKANESLKRKFPTSNEYVNNLLRRNWEQVRNADAVFAIGNLPGQFANTYVEGGTGWAVQMAKDINKPVYVFNQKDSKWYTFDNKGHLVTTKLPVLTKNFAGVGSREITEAGKKAIRDVYENTVKNGAQTSIKSATVTTSIGKVTVNKKRGKFTVGNKSFPMSFGVKELVTKGFTRAQADEIVAKICNL